MVASWAEGDTDFRILGLECPECGEVGFVEISFLRSQPLSQGRAETGHGFE